MFKIKSQLPKNTQENNEHIIALSQMKADEKHHNVFEHLYDCLTILDDKSSALLSFNSIIIAVFALFIISGENEIITGALLFLGIISVMISCLFLLLVVWVHWSTSEDFQNLDQHGLNLLEVRKQRTIKYRLAWYFSTFSVAILFLYLVFLFLSTL